MIDFKTAQVRRHQQNLERYCRLLATELTNLQRQYLHKRIAEEASPASKLGTKPEIHHGVAGSPSGLRC